MERKFKVGDVVKVKSEKWYNDNRNGDSFVDLNTGDLPFVEEMIPFLGTEVEIINITDDCYVVKETDEYAFPEYSLGDVEYHVQLTLIHEDKSELVALPTVLYHEDDVLKYRETIALATRGGLNSLKVNTADEEFYYPAEILKKIIFKLKVTEI
jgi:hypothetical protein